MNKTRINIVNNRIDDLIDDLEQMRRWLRPKLGPIDDEDNISAAMKADMNFDDFLTTFASNLEAARNTIQRYVTK